MRGPGVFTCAVAALHLVLLASSLEIHGQNVLVVREKWSNADKKQILPRISLSTDEFDGSDACVSLRLRMKPLSNKTLQIEFNELGIQNYCVLLIQRGRHDNNTIWWKELFKDQRSKVKIRKHSSINKHLDVRRERVWELQYKCFMAMGGSTVHVAVLDFNQTLISDSYTVNQPPEDYRVPVYKVTPDILSKHFVVDVEAGQEVHMRLCYKSITVCEKIISQKINSDLNRTVTLHLPYLVPCLCVEMYYTGVDARRHTTCPLKDKILPGGGEVLSSSSLQLFGSSVLQWEHHCPSVQFKPDVSLCWQPSRNHSQCISIQNSTLLMRDLKYNVSDVDKHPHMCLKFFLNESHQVFCPFSSDLSEWDVTVVPGSWRLYVRLSSSIPASFSAQLCVKEGGTCDLKENVHTVQMEEGMRDVEMTVTLPFFTSGLCVQVWRSEPALRGRRIICPDFTHRRWGLVVAASLVLLVTITTVCIVTYKLIKRQTSVWRSAERKPVLLVCSTDETSHISAVCALAYGLQEELRMDVRLAQWAQCSTQKSLAQLGPAPWLYGQCQQVHSVGGMVLIAWSPKAQQTFLQWRESDSGGKVGKTGQKDKMLLEEWSDKQGQKCIESQSSITASVFNASLTSMWAGLQSERHGQGFGLVCFQGLSGTRCIPKELRGIRRYCLPRDLSNLIHELDINVHGPRSRDQNRSKWCCWPRLFSKGLSFWLSQRLARRLDAWLPRTPAKPDRKCLLKPSHKVPSEKALNKKLKKERRENICPHAVAEKNVECNLDTQKALLG
ncbi:interleukin-17 receptor E isoform X2 [Hemibagrus wyckioides]|uniref:interleukin-17 receptor E isoform X2 n=1 Tax=Hemibagrus wyckioides TaxID=337641 RepID=UPI00266C745E|nr:interleukin-17 receptor E isoform X2 [Hemibagrus wyckioides]